MTKKSDLPYLPITLLTPEEIDFDEKQNLERIQEEFKLAFEFIKKYPKSVSFFGSARFSPDNEHSEDARLLASKIASRGYAIITGGGPGIMEAANHGAVDANGTSVGIAINLPREQATNQYVRDSASFRYFFTRKTALSFAAEAFIFFPGGFGTLDEFFDILTLVQTKKIPQIPIILVGRDFWGGLDTFISHSMLQHHGTIREEEKSLYKIVDSHDEILKIIEEAPVSNWWKNFEA